MSSGDGSERTEVTTYVPEHQKERWRDHADDLGMSQSEFVRTMVQAGRRGFDPAPRPGEEQPRSDDADPGGNGLEDRVIGVLRSEGVADWDDLVEALSSDFEDRLESALDDLQAEDRVRYSGRHGGYELTDGR